MTYERDRLPTSQELRIILEAAGEVGGMPYVMALLGILTGMRASELARLEWHRIDLASGRLLYFFE